MSIRGNIERIRERIAAIARRVGRDPDQISLMAVCKTQPTERIIEAYEAGQRLFGENRVQEFAEKQLQLTDLRDARFHLIGHLQSNKAAKAVALFNAIDSVDSLKLAQRLNAAAADLKKKLPVLIEINVGGEEAKAGLPPAAPELDELLRSAPAFTALEMRGLMAIPPFTEDPNGARQYFKRLRSLHEEIAGRGLPGVRMEELSIGMSHDFEVAIEEGSTCVRIGTAIFGTRQ